MKAITVKSILNRKKKRDGWFLDEYTLNPYDGCSLNCQYCYVRGSKFGLNMEDKLSVKSNALEILERQLSFRAKNKQYGIIAMLSATDPYLRAEADIRMTEGLLKVILKYQFPVLIITRPPLVPRDLELLKEIDRRAILSDDLKGHLTHGAIVSFSLSTLDSKISQTLEPGAPLPTQRLEAMRTCAAAGLMIGMSCIPVLPYISDSNECLEGMVKEAKCATAAYVLIGGLTFFGNQPADSKTLYYRFLERSLPELIPGYKNLYRIFPAPSKEYLRGLDRRAGDLCLKHGIKRGMLPV